MHGRRTPSRTCRWLKRLVPHDPCMPLAIACQPHRVVQLAINYSPAAAELSEEGRIRFDAFKVPDDPGLLRDAGAIKPTFVHFALDAGSTTSQGQDLERVAKLRHQAAGTTPGSTPDRVNVQLAPSSLRFPKIAVDSTDAADRAEVTDTMAADVARVCERFGAEQVVIATLIYRGPDRGLLRIGVEADVVAEVAERCGCGFLLDLAHARLNAIALGSSRGPYLDALPTSRLRELHVSGIGIVDGRSIDHLGLADLDAPSLDEAIEQIGRGAWRKPVRLVFDYGGVGAAFAWRTNQSVLSTQVPLLDQVVTELSVPGPTSRSGTSPE